MSESVIAAIEAGGTKFLCGFGTPQGEILDHVRISTTSPAQTLPQVIAYFLNHPLFSQVQQVGLACFGPIEPNRQSASYGLIKATPKLAWRDFNIVAALTEALDKAIVFDTDVNAAALGEYYWGAGQGLDHLIYLTVGTGIGGGIIANGAIHHGVSHVEMGHLLIPLHQDEVDFRGICPSHGHCLEGLASGPAICQRFNVEDALALPVDHAAWRLEADYLAQALMNYALVLAPQRIILGGGVMQQAHLFPLMRERFGHYMQGYLTNDAMQDMSQFIVPAGCGQHAGLKGAVALALGNEPATR